MLECCFILRIPINYLLVNLAVADITYATFYIPKIIWDHIAIHPKGLFGRILCALLTDAALAWVGGASSIFTLVAVATERYYSVIYPHGNKGKLTKRKLKVSHRDNIYLQCLPCLKSMVIRSIPEGIKYLLCYSPNPTYVNYYDIS